MAREIIEKYSRRKHTYYYFRLCIGMKFDDERGVVEIVSTKGRTIQEYPCMGLSKDLILREIFMAFSAFIYFNIVYWDMRQYFDELLESIEKIEVLTPETIKMYLSILRALLRYSRFFEGQYIFRKNSCKNLFLSLSQVTGFSDKVIMLRDEIMNASALVASVIQTKMLESDYEISRALLEIKREESVVGSRLEILNLLISAFSGIDIGIIISSYAGINIILSTFLCTLVLFLIMRYIFRVLRESDWPMIHIEFDIVEYHPELKEYTLDRIIERYRSGNLDACITAMDIQPREAVLLLRPKGTSVINVTLKYIQLMEGSLYPTMLSIDVTPRVKMGKMALLLITIMALLLTVIELAHYLLLNQIFSILACVLLLLVLIKLLMDLYKGFRAVGREDILSSLRSTLRSILPPSNREYIMKKLERVLW